MKPVIIILLFLVVAASSLFGQTSYENYGIYTTSNGSLMVNLPRGSQLTQTKVLGPSGFLFEEYLPGKIYMRNDMVKSYDALKFKIESNELEVLVNSKAVFYTPDLIDGFSLETQDGTRIFMKALNPLSSTLEFWEVIFGNNGVMVLQNTDISYKKGDYNPALMVGNKDKYVEQKTFFLAENNQLKLISTGKKKVLSLFKEKAAKVNEYASANQIGFKEMDDVLKLVSFYSTLD